MRTKFGVGRALQVMLPGPLCSAPNGIAIGFRQGVAGSARPGEPDRHAALATMEVIAQASVTLPIRIVRRSLTARPLIVGLVLALDLALSFLSRSPVARFARMVAVDQ